MQMQMQMQVLILILVAATSAQGVFHSESALRSSA